ncbi:hypothetical protein ONZ45_g13938 [Pleurotus djamor]|nr:hypothetical protein ONZ45_g13938 [Pleurotus djamor]
MCYPLSSKIRNWFANKGRAKDDPEPVRGPVPDVNEGHPGVVTGNNDGLCSTCSTVLNIQQILRVGVSRENPIHLGPLVDILGKAETYAWKVNRTEEVHGRVVGEVVDMELIEKWVGICQTSHGDACERVWWRGSAESLPPTVRMIDVRKMCIIQAPRGCRFVALSYVWGGVGAEYQTMNDNYGGRTFPEGLDVSIVPATISDSITLCRELGETYLWVDALCIIQDNEDDKRVQISVMELIYGSAILTVFAVGGHNAHAGLPGLRHGSRSRGQRVEVIQDLHLTVPLPTILESLAQSVWGTRGWTYQEVMLSRRRLFFTKHQVYFECAKDVWSEDIIAEANRLPRSYHPLRYTGAGNFTYSTAPTTMRHEYTAGYTSAVEQYTKRALTNESDAIDAISALTNAIAKGFKLGEPAKAFRYGMAISDLDHAILWHPSQGQVRRRRDIPKGCPWPSWSWAGWSGGVQYSDQWSTSQTHARVAQSLIEHWYMWTNGRLEEIHVRKIYGMKFPEEPQIKNSYSPPEGRVEVGPAIDLTDGTLVFYSTTTVFRVKSPRERENSQDPSYSVFSIIPPSSENSPPAGKVWLGSDTPSSSSIIQFVAISRSNGETDLYSEETYGPYYSACFLYVMAVRKMTENGLLERLGIGIIYEQAWIQSGSEKQCQFASRRVIVVDPQQTQTHDEFRHQVAELLEQNHIWDMEYLALEATLPDSSEWIVSLNDVGVFSHLAQAISRRILETTLKRTVLLGSKSHDGVARCLPSALLASLVATGLSATELQFIGAQDGLYTANPRMVPMAQLLPMVSSGEWAELAMDGSYDQSVNIAVKQALRQGIPVRIRSSKSSGVAGTLIHPRPEGITSQRSTPSEIIQGRRVADCAAPGWQHRDPKLPTAVTIKEDVQVLEVSSMYGLGSTSFIPEVFGILNESGIRVELLSTSVMHVSIAIRVDSTSEDFHRLLSELEQRDMVVAVHQNMAVLSLIGRRMQSTIGTAGRLFSVLAKYNVNIEMMSQGASQTNISCVISGKDALKALNLVHHACLSAHGYPGTSPV